MCQVQHAVWKSSVKALNNLTYTRRKHRRQSEPTNLDLKQAHFSHTLHIIPKSSFKNAGIPIVRCLACMTTVNNKDDLAAYHAAGPVNLPSFSTLILAARAQR